jgi:predicted RNase H-like nuclease
VAVEVYPAVVARRFLARASYKNDERRKQTTAHRDARERLVAGLESETLKRAYGFTVKTDAFRRAELVRDPAADALDSLLCAVQAAWAYTKKDNNYGVPPECDPNEGWIVDPHLLEKPERQPT